MTSIPVLLVSSIEEVLRDSLMFGVLCDEPAALVVRYEVDARHGTLRRYAYTAHSVLEDTTAPLQTCCLTCAVRNDIAANLSRLSSADPAAVLLALPATMDPVPIAFGVDNDLPGGELEIVATVAVAAAETLEPDLFGDDLLLERALGWGEEDRRAVGEALVRQLETADVVVLGGEPSARVSAVLDHLIGDQPRRYPLHGVDVAALLGCPRSQRALHRGDLRRVEPSGAADGRGVWTLDLASWRPLHPVRLLAQLERLGAGALRGRGYFWLPSRPDMRCAWDGSGGQLSVGELDRWTEPASTRLVITGIGRGARKIRTAFESALMTDAELAAGLASWQDTDDGWDFWLGPRDADAAASAGDYHEE
ncbi:MAG: GTP-binding protein [Sporichthyaceae bacterium]